MIGEEICRNSSQVFSESHSSATGVKAAVEPALSEMGEHFRHLNFPAEIQRWREADCIGCLQGDLNVAVAMD